MGFLLFAAFVGVPLLEIAVFIVVGREIGLWPTLGAVVLTAIAGSALLRLQGLATLYKAREHIDKGEVPVDELFDGLCLVAAGALLLTPGFVTDTLGLLLFVPPFRRSAQRWLGTRIQARTTVHRAPPGGPDGPSSGPAHGPAGAPVIDGDYIEIEPDRKGPNQSRRAAASFVTAPRLR